MDVGQQIQEPSNVRWAAYPALEDRAIFTPFIEHNNLMSVSMQQVRRNETFEACANNKAFYREDSGWRRERHGKCALYRLAP